MAQATSVRARTPLPERLRAVLFFPIKARSASPFVRTSSLQRRSWHSGLQLAPSQMASVPARFVAGGDLRTGELWRSSQQHGCISGIPQLAAAMDAAAMDVAAEQDVTAVQGNAVQPGLRPPTGTTGLSQGVSAMHLEVAADPAAPTAAEPSSLPSRRPALWLPASALAPLLETVVLQHFDVVQAAAVFGDKKIGLTPKAAISGWAALHPALRGLAFQPDASDAWLRLGLTPLEGPEPTVALVEQRLDVARLLLSASEHPEWPADDVAAARDALRSLDEARRTCIAELPALKRRRPVQGDRALPRWAELGRAARQVLAAEPLIPTEVYLTQLSALESSADELPNRFLEPAAARWMVEQLFTKGPDALIAASLPAATVLGPRRCHYFGALAGCLCSPCDFSSESFDLAVGYPCRCAGRLLGSCCARRPMAACTSQPQMGDSGAQSAVHRPPAGGSFRGRCDPCAGSPHTNDGHTRPD